MLLVFARLVTVVCILPFKFEMNTVDLHAVAPSTSIFDIKSDPNNSGRSLKIQFHFWPFLVSPHCPQRRFRKLHALSNVSCFLDLYCVSKFLILSIPILKTYAFVPFNESSNQLWYSSNSAVLFLTFQRQLVIGKYYLCASRIPTCNYLIASRLRTLSWSIALMFHLAQKAIASPLHRSVNYFIPWLWRLILSSQLKHAF